MYTNTYKLTNFMLNLIHHHFQAFVQQDDVGLETTMPVCEEEFG